MRAAVPALLADPRRIGCAQIPADDGVEYPRQCND